MSSEEQVNQASALAVLPTVTLLKHAEKGQPGPRGTLTLNAEHHALVWVPEEGRKARRKSFRNSTSSSIFTPISPTPSATSTSTSLSSRLRASVRPVHMVVAPLTYIFAVRHVHPEASLPLTFPVQEGSVTEEETDRFAVFWVERSKDQGHVKSLTFRTPSSPTDAAKWIRVIRRCIYPDTAGKLPLSRIYLILNPFGGTKKAPKIWESPVKPMFELAGIQTTLTKTERSGHARELTRDMDVDAYDAVVTISGDGLIHEVMNGLCSRPDWESAVKKLTVGAIAGGTVNALPMNLDLPSPILCALSIIRGRKHPMDMHLVTHYPSGSRYVSHLMFSWGLVADVDIESEIYRWAGPARLNVGLAARLLNIRHYPGTLHYLTDEVSESESGDGGPAGSAPGSNGVPLLMEPSGSQGASGVGSASSQEASNGPIEPRKGNGGLREEEVEVAGIKPDLPGPRGQFTSPILARELKKRKALEDGFDGLPKGWKTVRSKFTFLGNGNLPRISADAMIAPSAQLSDGTLHLSWIESIGLWKLVPILLRMADGSHTQDARVHHHRVQAFILEGQRLEGGPGPSKHGGIINVDGEEVGRSCQGEAWAVEILPSLVTIVVPPWFEENQP
ncbi:ATP-NAD kinase-like domain-containing protein [Piptocephalis cylindrospora]|uniref:ATP-NAD kinase-like domain-containing protein n=1 Tax=Piptocephalis cylindrospora TaxID=1907219 RepID=A0A4P9Y4V2_9FUNG|nr:ATP-NAD kinase-like domain-containing protein [Piptocephalis cylindrospora]|eukprot:RKP13977.1 ATP-NAD kinase-like domain-containing protein [Piptocephalis cylindrospora]